MAGIMDCRLAPRLDMEMEAAHDPIADPRRQDIGGVRTDRQ
jgi:hypothetical protein